MKKRSFLHEILFYIVILVAIVIVLSTLFNDANQKEPLTYDDILRYFDNKQVTEVIVTEDNKLILTVMVEGSPTKVEYQLRSFDVFYYDLSSVINEQIKEGVITKYEPQPPTKIPVWVSWLPVILIVLVFVILYFVAMRQASGKGGGKFNSFGKARVKVPSGNDKNKVLFRDVAGADEEKEELVEIVEFLKDPSKFTKLGAKIPHGVLLQGPPGTGKTLLAKAVAGEAGVPFYSISGSDFVEMYVGVGASRVRDLFETARKSPAAIIFIDEIDAVGRHRGAGLGGGHDEREQTLNQLLVEMDGFGSHDGIIVMAATNRPDILDPALLRPGRFDRQVTVNYPDIRGREEILKVHARNKPMESGVDFHKIAQSTVGFTGADLANLLNEAALAAAKKNKSLIGMDDIEDAYMKELLGPQKKSRIRSEKENKLTAYHEAGHAVVSYYCKNTDPVKLITIIPAGRAGGVTVSRPEDDKHYATRDGMLDDIRMSLGGRVAEELIMDDISTGASGDIQQATQMARGMVTRYGMSDKLGMVLYGSGHAEVFLGRDYGTGKEYSEQTAAAIDEEIQRIIGECHDDAKAILSEHIDKLHFVAQYLLKHESMDGDQFEAAMKDGATEEDLLAIAEQKAEQSRRDNEARAAEEQAKEEEARRAADPENAEQVPTDDAGDFYEPADKTDSADDADQN
ncbi:MAG: ATP-dependent zinc metalloprotease FtsH [Clostridia bacterium]|nr:ATP-dependent zinc metalloprotease FtsH [Clostridia bacterium]